MGGFKLIAIVPLKGCTKKYRKTLKIGTPYQFYSPYKIILNETETKIISIEKKQSKIPFSLYALENGINLNFSAVVGKNGSGKSTLFELLYYLIYIIGIEKKIGNRELLLPPSKDKENKKRQLVDDYKSLEEKISKFKLVQKRKNEENYNDSLDYHCNDLINKYNLQIKPEANWRKTDFYNNVLGKIGYQSALYNLLINEEIEKEFKIKEGLNLSVVFEINNDIYEITHYNNNFHYNTYDETTKMSNSLTIDEFNLSKFFYSVSINYSHHALNSKILGNWISKLFHKNDAYTTPLVINPMRDEGNFNINDELELSKERLMSNLIFDLIQDKRSLLLGKYRVSKFIFTPKKLNVETLAYNQEFLVGLNSGFLIKKLVGIEKIDEYIDYWEFAIGYLEDKLTRIKKNYSFLIYHKDQEKSNETKFNDFLLNDSSHITKKLRQVINFLKTSNKKENRSFWKVPNDNVRVEKNRDDILEWLGKFGLDLKALNPSELIEYALPGFFSIDFELEDLQDHKIQFGNLSSGEQQMILNINAIQYHLYNLQSVHDTSEKIVEINNRTEIKARVEYENINIILDEIELYYHPEMQRLLVKNLMDSFENIRSKGEKGIKSINVCFLTHSPFILSDIPSENVLRLDENINEGEAEIEETFAANINDLLANGFFMETLMGEFADSKITRVIDNISKKEFKEEDNQIIEIMVVSQFEIS